MQFLNPLGLLTLLGIPAIVFMYLLKQKFKEKKVPSLFLWKQAASFSQSQQPWQKLKKNLLFFLQILAVGLLALGLADPFFAGWGEKQNYILVLDQSMSMQAKDENPTRFEAAKKQIQKFVEDAAPETGISLIVLGHSPYLAVNNSTQKREILSALDQIPVTNGSVDLENCQSLLEMQQEQTKGKILLFTDQNYSWDSLNIQSVLVGNSIENCAVTLLSHTIEGENTAALAKVQNFGTQEAVKTVTLYQDEAVFDVQEITLAPGENKDILFKGISPKTKKLAVSLSPTDVLEADDIRYDTLNNQSNQKALFFSNQNIFLEKMLSILPNIELYRGKTDEMENLEGYGLYVFDGMLPETLPTDGHILILHPPEGNSLLETGKEVQIGRITQGSGRQFEMEADFDFAIAQSRKIVTPSWAEAILQSNETPVLLAGEKESQKYIIFGFDLHQSDLPLKKEFPILVYHMMDWLFPTSIFGMENAICGDSLEFSLFPNTQKASVLTPQLERKAIAPPFPVETFTGTEQAGIYTLEQENTNGLILSESFAVNAAAEEESDLTQTEAEEIEAEQNTKMSAGKSIRNWILILLLLLLGAEWWVNCCDH